MPLGEKSLPDLAEASSLMEAEAGSEVSGFYAWVDRPAEHSARVPEGWGGRAAAGRLGVPFSTSKRCQQVVYIKDLEHWNKSRI